MTRRGPRLPALAVAVAAVAGCSVPGATAAAKPPTELTVLAAASLQGPLERLAAAWQATSGTTLRIATDSSAALRAQIEHGAPADVFLSADTTNPDVLADAGLADGDPVAFAANELIVAIPKDDPAGLESPRDLARPGVRIIAAGEEVPVTRYTNQVIERLAGIEGYPADFASAYQANVVSREDNVRAVLAKIQLGEGDAGIVYVTDARAGQGIDVVELPREANVVAVYSGVVVKATDTPALARSFLDWIAGPEGQAILHEHGFLAAP